MDLAGNSIFKYVRSPTRQLFIWFLFYTSLLSRAAAAPAAVRNGTVSPSCKSPLAHCKKITSRNGDAVRPGLQAQIFAQTLGKSDQAEGPRFEHTFFGGKVNETSMRRGTAKWHREEVLGSDFSGSLFRFRDCLYVLNMILSHVTTLHLLRAWLWDRFLVQNWEW